MKNTALFNPGSTGAGRVFDRLTRSSFPSVARRELTTGFIKPMTGMAKPLEGEVRLPAESFPGVTRESEMPEVIFRSLPVQDISPARTEAFRLACSRADGVALAIAWAAALGALGYCFYTAVLLPWAS